MSLNRKCNRNNHQQVALERPIDGISVELATHCNLTCKMCSKWKRRELDIDSDKVISLLVEARALGAKQFSTFGTEPFMRKDTVDILTYAERIGFLEVSTVSNGLLLNDKQILDKLEKLKTLIMVISLDGPKEVHDELRGKGVFDKAVETLRELRNRGITTSMMKYVPPYFTRGVRFIPPNGCHVPSKVLKVDSSGNCYPCVMIRKRMKQKSIGNVYEKSLEDLWHNQIHQELNLFALNRKCPSCLAGCSDVESYNAIGKKIWPLKLITRVVYRLGHH